MLGDFLFELVPAVVVHQLDVHAGEVALQVFLDGGGALLLDGFVGGILVVVGGDVGDQLHAVDLVRRQVGVGFVEVEAGGGIVGFLGLVGEREAHGAVFRGDRPFASALDAGLVLHEVDFLGVVGALALDALGDDGAANVVPLLDHQHDEIQPFVVVDFCRQIRDFGNQLAGFEVGVLVGGHQLLEGDGFGDGAAVVEVVIHLMVVAFVLPLLHDVDDDSIAFLADKTLDFLVVIGREVDFSVFVHGNALGKDFHSGFRGALLAHLFVITLQTGLPFGVGDIFLVVARFVEVEGAVVAQHEGGVHALHGHVGVEAEAHVGVLLVKHHVGGLHVFEDGLHQREAEVVVGVFRLAHVGFRFGHQFLAVARQAVLAQTEEGGLVRGVVVQRLLVLGSLEISLELRGGVQTDVVFQLRHVAEFGPRHIHHVGETLVQNFLVVVVRREIPHIFGIFLQCLRIEPAVLIFGLSVCKNAENQ